MADPDKGRYRFFIAILIAILAVSTASIFIKYAEQQAPALVISAWRLAIASLALAPLAWTRHRSELRAVSRRGLGLGLLSGVFLALHFALWISSLEYTSVASSVVLVSTTPLWVALIAPFALREPMKPNEAAGIGLALIGGTLIALADTCQWRAGLVCPPLGEFFKAQAPLGNLLALASAWMAAGYLLIGRRLRAGLALIPYVSLVYTMAALVLIALMFAAGQSPLGYPALTYVWLVALALIPQLVGHSIFNWALRYLPASFVSVMLLGEPVGATLLAYFLLGETPGIFKLAGGGLILAGIFLVSRNTPVPKHSPKVLPPAVG